MDLPGRQRGVRKQAFAQVREVAVGIARRSHAFVHLHDVDGLPGNVLAGERAQHDPRRMPAADGHDEATPRGDRRPRVGGNHGRRPRGHGAGVGEDLDLHATPAFARR